MCILDIIISIIYDCYHEPFNTESNNVSKKRCKKDERNGTVFIPQTSEQERIPKQNYLTGNNKSMVFVDGILGGTWVNMCSSAEEESLEYSGLKSRPEKKKISGLAITNDHLNARRIIGTNIHRKAHRIIGTKNERTRRHSK